MHPKHPLDWEKINSKYVLNEKWIKVRSDDFKMPNGNIISPFYVLEYPDWVNAVAITEDRQVILTKLFRPGIGATVLELPSGSVDPNESPEETIQRELLEETGYFFDTIIHLSTCAPNPANQSNLVHGFLALNGVKKQEQQLDESEQIELIMLTIEEFIELLNNNQLIQAMHVTAGHYALQKLQELDWI
ncbi:MAG: NUDIX hydrolase [Bacteroidota bacterium]